MKFDYIDENIIKQYPAIIEYDGDAFLRCAQI